MRISIGSDHAGFEVKERLKEALEQSGHAVTDVGTHNDASCDYPDFAEAVARSVAAGECDRGVLLCGTGIGQSIVANKVPGVRAALVHDETTTRMSREHNDANVFCAGTRVLDSETILRLAELWLQTEFTGGRHQRRVEKINKLDEK